MFFRGADSRVRDIARRFEPSSLRPMLGFAAALLCVAAGAQAIARPDPPGSDDRPRVRAVRVTTPPRIDGRLDDAVWSRAEPIGPLVQVEPVEGGQPSERTEVRILYDADFLYVGVRCFDREPEKLIARQRSRDPDLSGDDRLAFVFDTFHDRRNAFFFQVNPQGSRRDALIENSRTFRSAWDGIWYAKTSVDAKGWVAEMALPFKTLGFDPKQTVWGFNVLRAVRRRNETNRWANARQNRSFIDIAGAGVIEGLVGLEQGLGLDIKPSGSFRWLRDREDGRALTDLDPSLDVFYRFTPFLIGALTVNTDFSETAVDVRRVNLSRFRLFFPETRDFFLQDAGIFDFGGLQQNGRPFFSRRIGILPEGGTAQVRGGVKLTGRAGRWNLGLLDTQMSSEGELEGKNLFAGRVSYNVLDESSVGVVFTRGDPATNGRNLLAGADFRYRSSQVFGNQVMTGDLWFQKSSTGDVSDQQAAFGLALGYPNDKYSGALGFLEIQEDFFPALGFVNRTGIRQYSGGLRRRWRPDGELRTVDTGFLASLVTDRSNELESLFVQLDWISLTNEAGDTVGARSVHRVERLSAAFEISEGVALPARTYHFHRGFLFFRTANSRSANVGLQLGFGEFFDGHRLQSILDLAWRPTPQFHTSLSYEENRIELAEGSFTTRIGRLRVDLNFTAELKWEILVQYDNVSDTASVFSRLRWIVEPGNEFFLVLDQGFDVDGSKVRGVSTSLVTKLVWTFRF